MKEKVGKILTQSLTGDKIFLDTPTKDAIMLQT